MKAELLSSNDSKTRAYPGQRNTFGLLPGPASSGFGLPMSGTCPGATFGPGGCMEIRPGRKCPICYVHKLIGFRKNITAGLARNTELLRNADKAGMVGLLSAEFARFKKADDRHGQAGTCNYRLHWSGDIFSATYADALVEAMALFPDINFWGYTRSLSEYPKFANSANCKFYLSVDDVNFKQGYPIYQSLSGNPNMSIAYLRETKPDGLELSPCPADNGSIPHVGACHRCRQCMRGAPVWFKTR